MPQASHFLVGVIGGSGSGKTTFVRILRAFFEEHEVCIVNQDNYYKPIHKIGKDNNGIENFDLPVTIDKKAFRHDLKCLMQGKTVELEEYVFNHVGKESHIITVKPAPIIVAEGLFVMHFKKIRQMLDLSVFVDCEDTLKVVRRIKRDLIERNYPSDDVLYRYEHHVLPAYQKYVAPYRGQSDLVINNYDEMLKGISFIAAGFCARIHKPFDEQRLLELYRKERKMTEGA